MTERETWTEHGNGSVRDEKDKDPFHRRICTGRRLGSHSHRNGIVKPIAHDGDDKIRQPVSSAKRSAIETSKGTPRLRT